jgi:hypothetical protein
MPEEAQMKNTVRIEQGKVCVYSHSIDGTVIYIGKGIPARPFHTNRTKQWHDVVDPAGRFDVQILSWHSTDAEARKEETFQILKLKPIANLQVKGGSRASTSFLPPFLAINIEPELLAKIDDFRFKNRFASRVQAVKWLLAYVLSQKPKREP